MAVKLLKRPRVNDVLNTGEYGLARVGRVMAQGLKLEITDVRGVSRMIERAMTGRWTKVVHDEKENPLADCNACRKSHSKCRQLSRRGSGCCEECSQFNQLTHAEF